MMFPLTAWRMMHYAFYFAYYVIPQFPPKLPIMLKNMLIIYAEDATYYSLLILS